MTLAAGAHFDALHNRAIELQPPFRRRGINSYFRLRAHHSTPDVVANRPHRHRAAVKVRD